LAEARRYVAEHHRHNEPPRGHKFSIGVATVPDGELVGVAIVGRPVARHFDNGRTVEATRVCTEGYPNANSMLYGAVARASFALGYCRVVTYTETGETGASLRAAGWRIVAERPARANWHDSSVALRSRRNPKGRGWVERTLWETVP
jgi:hypothetical protein